MEAENSILTLFSKVQSRKGKQIAEISDRDVLEYLVTETNSHALKQLLLIPVPEKLRLLREKCITGSATTVAFLNFYTAFYCPDLKGHFSSFINAIDCVKKAAPKGELTIPIA
jgi:hypothetical protein